MSGRELLGGVRHLGDKVSAFVDDRLDLATREQVLRHLQRCGACRSAVEEERWVAARLQTLPGAEPSAALLQSLQRIGTGAPVPTAGAVGAAVAATPSTGLLHTPRRRGSLLLAGAGSFSAGLLGLAYLVGGAADQPAPVVPAVGEFSAEFAGQRDGMPFSHPAVGVTTVLHQSWPPADQR